MHKRCRGVKAVLHHVKHEFRVNSKSQVWLGEGQGMLSTDVATDGS